jgi:hypothetical protein
LETLLIKSTFTLIAAYAIMVKKEVPMSKINAIRKAIETLSEDEYVELRQWFSERDWKKWDREIEKDSKAGKLDFLVREAFDQKRQGKLKDL